MRTHQAALLFFAIILAPLNGAPAVNSANETEPIIISDAALLSSIQKKIGKYAEAENGPSADDLAKQINSVPKALDFEIPQAKKNTNPAASVYIISSVYLCGKCDLWHAGGVASAWALSKDGLIVTNHHVIANAKGNAMGVSDRNGNTHRVIKILAADKANDIAIIRVDSNELLPLEIGPTAPIGEEVEVISNPNRKFFTHTFGRVSRYHSQPARNDGKSTVKMSITADYAKGSSGAPVLDSKGRVTGMVASTNSIYTPPTKGKKPAQNLQMVIKNCVTISAIRDMLLTPETTR
jgi:serine protease Do